MPATSFRWSPSSLCGRHLGVLGWAGTAGSVDKGTKGDQTSRTAPFRGLDPAPGRCALARIASLPGGGEQGAGLLGGGGEVAVVEVEVAAGVSIDAWPRIS